MLGLPVTMWVLMYPRISQYTIIPSENLKTQELLNTINKLPHKQKLQLNEKKIKSMIFNFRKKKQFTTKLEINKVNIEIVKEAKLLDTFINSNLSWNKNTGELVKNATIV